MGQLQDSPKRLLLALAKLAGVTSKDHAGVSSHDLTNVPCVACNDQCSNLHADVTSTGRSYYRDAICGGMGVAMLVLQNGQFIKQAMPVEGNQYKPKQAAIQCSLPAYL